MTSKLSILYLDLNSPDLIEDFEPKNPKRYGGGRIVAAHLRPWCHANGHNMEIWANPLCFENIPDNEQRGCVPISKFIADTLKNGGELRQFLRDNFIPDIVFHNFPGVKINCNGLPTKDAVWFVGVNETANPENKRIILYNQYQNARVGSDAKVYYARIGVPIPEFQEYTKEHFVFSCHRQAKEFGSETMMQLAHQYKFRYITAGPTDRNFQNIHDYIDNDFVTYLGVISEKEKASYFKRACASSYLHSWPVPFNLSLCQSLSYGTPVIASPKGFLPSIVRDGVNGYIVTNENTFLNALTNCKNQVINQRDCYDSVLNFSSDKMIEDYMAVFTAIINEP